MRDDDTARPPYPGGRSDPFVELIDGSRHDELVRRRVAAREVADRAQDLVTLRGAVQDLAEARALVSLRLRDGRDLAGILVGAGVDHLALQVEDRTALVRLAAIASLVSTQAEVVTTPASGFPADRDLRDPSFDPGAPLLDVLTELQATVDQVAVGSLGRADPLRGRLQSVGADVIVLALSGRVRAVVTEAALTDVSWGPR